MKHSDCIALFSLVLAMTVNAQDRPSEALFGSGEYDGAANVRSTQVFRSISAALDALPALPSPEQVSSDAAKYLADSLTYAPYNVALQQSLLARQYEINDIDARMLKTQQKQAQRGQAAMQQYNKNVEAGLMPSQQEMMQILMSSGINLDKASEQQIMDVVAGAIAPKWGVSKDEYLKIVTMAQRNPKQTEAYLQTNHPELYKRLYAANKDGLNEEIADDTRNDRFGQLGEQINALQQQLSAASDAYQRYSAAGLRDEFYQDWLASDEAKQIDAIEKALWERIDQWVRGLPVNTTEAPYPGWWVDERKKENALIDQWNKRAAQRWVSEIAKNQQFTAVFEQAAALEEENERLGKQGDPDNFIYLMNKRQLLIIFNQLTNLFLPYRDAMLFPCVQHLEVDGAAHLGKG